MAADADRERLAATFERAAALYHRARRDYPDRLLSPAGASTSRGYSSVRAPGDSPAPGLLAVNTLRKTVREIPSVVVRGSRRSRVFDALLIQPEIEHVVLANNSNATALPRSFARATELVVSGLPVRTTTRDETDAETGRLVKPTCAPADDLAARILAGGFAVASGW